LPAAALQQIKTRLAQDEQHNPGASRSLPERVSPLLLREASLVLGQPFSRACHILPVSKDVVP